MTLLVLILIHRKSNHWSQSGGSPIRSETTGCLYPEFVAVGGNFVPVKPCETGRESRVLKWRGSPAWGSRTESICNSLKLVFEIELVFTMNELESSR